jgi:hypothetical protein
MVGDVAAIGVTFSLVEHFDFLVQLLDRIYSRVCATTEFRIDGQIKLGCKRHELYQAPCFTASVVGDTWCKLWLTNEAFIAWGSLGQC